MEVGEEEERVVVGAAAQRVEEVQGAHLLQAAEARRVEERGVEGRGVRGRLGGSAKLLGAAGGAGRQASRAGAGGAGEEPGLT